MGVKHIFLMQIGAVRYKDRRVYTDDEFDEIMDRLQWNLPSKISVYHFQGDGHMKNPAVMSYPYAPIDIVSLLHANTRNLHVWDKIRKRKRKVLCLADNFAILDWPEIEWFVCTEIDGKSFILQGKLQPIPITLESAKKFVNAHHRHNVAALGHKFSVGLMIAGYSEVVGVVITSTPKAKCYGPEVLEVNRVCVFPPVQNGCSKLYGVAIRIARIMGYRAAVTYTLPDEDAASVRAAGFTYAGMTQSSKGWSRAGRPRGIPARYPTGPKKRWLQSL